MNTEENGYSNERLEFTELEGIIITFYKKYKGKNIMPVYNNDDSLWPNRYKVLGTDDEIIITPTERDDILKDYYANNDKSYIYATIEDDALNVKYIDVKAVKNVDHIQEFVQNIEERAEESKKKYLEQLSNQNYKPREYETPVREMEVRKDLVARRRFEIINRERQLDDSRKKQTRSLIFAGLCILGATAAIYFNPTNPDEVIKNEVQAIYSWEAAVEYIKDLGPLVSLLSAGTAGFIAKYIKQEAKEKQIQGELDDLNTAYSMEDGGRTL